MAKQDPVSELIDIINAAEPQDGRIVWDHTPEEVGLHVMENHDAIRTALSRPAREEVSGEEVERVARAICRNHIGQVWDEDAAQKIVDESWDAWKEDARAAIAAMNPKPAEAASGAGGEADFLRDLADRLCKTPCLHHDGYDIDRLRELAVALQSRSTPATEKAVERDAISDIISDVAELPDRDSPEDWPDAMIVTGEELRIILERYTAPPAADVAAMREAVRLGLEDAEALDRTAEDADDNGWMDWGALMRQSAIRIRALAALPEEPSA